MGSIWRKAKEALGLKSCFYVPSETLGDDDNCDSSSTSVRNVAAARFPDVADSSRRSSDRLLSVPVTPTSSGFGHHKLSKTFSKSSKNTCAICLNSMKPGQGHAIFTAECSHAFHFHCITSNVKHGNQVCPVCRAKWKEVPFQNSVSDLPHARSRINPGSWLRDDPITTLIRRLPPPRLEANRHITSVFHATEPGCFDDDELLPKINEQIPSLKEAAESSSLKMIEVKTFAEVSAVSRSTSRSKFTILIHLKAPHISKMIENSRAPVDLVTVLDVSGSMAGTKLVLLKRAMGFVIQNLGPSDRLSVIAFSSNARRVFPLIVMSDAGKQQALQAVNSLKSNGGTNIAEGLKKGAKVIVDRKWKNPVSSIILLSDGQDTYSVNVPGRSHQIDYQLLLPKSILRCGGSGVGSVLQIPVHAFGFGVDHDASSMHSISEMSGGTFSFIETESVIQDAFAQCIGGLLSVVIQGLVVEMECVHHSLRLTSINAGSYQTRMEANARVGFIDVGDLYAEEERDFLVTVDIPVDENSDETSLLKVKCVYENPITKETVNLVEHDELKILRPERVEQPLVSIEVDRQLNRLNVTHAMAEARIVAENGALSAAVSILDGCWRKVSESLSAQTGDKLCIALCAELKEMQERMANRRVYEESGRAYVLSGLSSHSWQRATARGDSTDSTSLMQAYQTPSMVDMVTHSQTMVFGNPSRHPLVRPSRSFSERPLPR